MFPARGTGTNVERPTEYFQSAPCAWYWYEHSDAYRIFSKCSLRVVLVRRWSRLPNIFKVLRARGTGTNMEPPTEYFQSAPCAWYWYEHGAPPTEYFQSATCACYWYEHGASYRVTAVSSHVSLADKISDSPENRQIAPSPVRDPVSCWYLWRPLSFAAFCVSGSCCPRPLLCGVHFFLGRTCEVVTVTKRPGKSSARQNGQKHIFIATPRPCACGMGPMRRTARIFCNRLSTSPGAS